MFHCVAYLYQLLNINGAWTQKILSEIKLNSAEAIYGGSTFHKSH